MTFCPLAKFKKIFGEPGKGIHKYNIMGTAIADYLLTLLLAFAWTYITGLPLVLSTILWFIVGIVSHMLFGVKTHTLEYLGFKC
jgi:hypothetical protein